MDALVKALELAAKYAWSVFTVSAVILFAPDDLVARLELKSFRHANSEYLWLVFLFSGALSLGSALPTVRRFLWRYAFCPCKKLLFPAVDLRSKIKQSRIHYFRVQFSYRNGDKPIYYHAVSSNGSACGFFDDSGQRILPMEPNDGHVRLDDGAFHHPRWGKLDWSDLFNGQANSGLWGIVER